MNKVMHLAPNSEEEGKFLSRLCCEHRRHAGVWKHKQMVQSESKNILMALLLIKFFMKKFFEDQKLNHYRTQ